MRLHVVNTKERDGIIGMRMREKELLFAVKHTRSAPLHYISSYSFLSDASV